MKQLFTQCTHRHRTTTTANNQQQQQRQPHQRHHWRMAPFVFSVVLIINSTLWSSASAAELNPPQAQTEEVFLREHPELRKFFSLAKEHPFLKAALGHNSGTLYAPTDDAIAEYTRQTQNQLANNTLLYHFTNVPKWAADLEDSVSTEIAGNSPIWITRKHGDVFLNDAKIKRSNLLVKIDYNGYVQVVHIIDKVLEPTIPIISTATNLNNPDAKRYLENSGSFQPFYYNYQAVKYNQARISISDFAARVAKLERLDLFKHPGRNTFFIPVNDAFKNQAKIGNVDAKVVSGHIVIGRAIFLNSADLAQPYETYETAAGPNNFPVYITLDKVGDTWQVMSDNRIESVTANHQKGKVVAQIVKGNIPVANGVIHFISKPLVIINSNLYDVLAGDDQAGLMHGFLKLLKDKDAVGNFNIIPQLEHVDDRRKLTLFVPTTEAIESSSILAHARGSRNHTAIKEIIQLHIVEQYLPHDTIEQTPAPFIVQSQLKDRKLYFHVVRNQTRSTILIEGGGTIATVLHTDIGATNGVIHVIDRVLGVEHQTIYEKLKTDPLLNSTFLLTSQDKYNEIFNDINKRFTLFAPINSAWQNIQREYPSEYLKLEIGRFGYQVGRIMDRHIIIDQELTMEQLHNVSLGSNYQSQFGLQTGTEFLERWPVPTYTREGIRVVGKNEALAQKLRDKYGPDQYWQRQRGTTTGGDFKYILYWARKEAFVVRANVKCTNGIIHYIDTVLMQPGDVYVNSAESLLTSRRIFAQYFLSALIPLISVWFLLRD